jgi:hypothetical protein
MKLSGALGCVLRNNRTGLATYVFYGPVEDAAHRASFAPALLLGMVITHELGHFFGLKDGLGGIMLPGFHQAAMLQALSGRLTFDKVEAQCLRTAIATRLRQLGVVTGALWSQGGNVPSWSGHTYL